MINNINKLLVVVAHPDDEVLGCGGLIYKLTSNNKKIRVVILGEGSSCRFHFEKINSKEVREAINERELCAKRSFEILGVKDFHFEKYHCGRFDNIPIIDIGKKIEDHIIDFKPDTLITHSYRDANSDHRIVANAAIVATRPIPGSSVKNLLMTEVLSSSEWRFIEQFQPNLFVDIKDSISTKIKAFECFHTESREFPFPRSSSGIDTLAKYRGMQAGLEYCEAFELVRAVL